MSIPADIPVPNMAPEQGDFDFDLPPPPVTDLPFDIETLPPPAAPEDESFDVTQLPAPAVDVDPVFDFDSLPLPPPIENSLKSPQPVALPTGSVPPASGSVPPPPPMPAGLLLSPAQPKQRRASISTADIATVSRVICVLKWHGS